MIRVRGAMTPEAAGSTAGPRTACRPNPGELQPARASEASSAARKSTPANAPFDIIHLGKSALNYGTFDPTPVEYHRETLAWASKPLAGKVRESKGDDNKTLTFEPRGGVAGPPAAVAATRGALVATRP